MGPFFYLIMSQNNKQQRPSFLLGLTEGGRAAIELFTYLPYSALRKLEKTGDDHPVLVLPGFMATDLSTIPLRKYLKGIGYRVYGWDQGRNYAKLDYIELLHERLDGIYHKYHRQVSIIGWSLGGVYARQMAKESPELVRQIITLGSPFKGVTKANNAKWIYDILTNGKGEAQLDPEIMIDIPKPAPVPTTAIYSKEDGVVPWKACMETPTDIHQNVQVHGSHLGLGVNVTVMEIIADRLQYDQSNWKQFIDYQV